VQRFVFVESPSGKNRVQLLRNRVRFGPWRDAMTKRDRGERLADRVFISERLRDLLRTYWRWWVVEAVTVRLAWATLRSTGEAAYVAPARHGHRPPMGCVLVSGGRDPKATVRP
jgi:hypothetical protein